LRNGSALMEGAALADRRNASTAFACLSRLLNVRFHQPQANRLCQFQGTN
jgi:hypothetical protein